MPAPVTRRVRLLAAAVLLTPGCAHARPDPAVTAGYRPADALRARGEQLGEAAGAAARRFDRAADHVGRVLYPPLYVLAYPLWFLSGNKGPLS